MRTLLSERYAPITSKIGFLESSLEEASRATVRWRRSLAEEVAARSVDGELSDVLPLLEPLSAGARPRELLVSVGAWTAYFDNSLRGTDAVSAISHLSRDLRCTGVAVASVPHQLGQAGVVNGRMGSVQFEMFGPIETSFLNYVRTLSTSFDGRRWRFDATGTEQTFEETATYDNRRVRDRFTSAMLERYCQSLGIDVFKPSAYGPSGVLIESPVSLPSNGNVMSLLEAQAWLEIVPGAADDIEL